jgi:hypothetical protein
VRLDAIDGTTFVPRSEIVALEHRYPEGGNSRLVVRTRLGIAYTIEHNPNALDGVDCYKLVGEIILKKESKA